MLSEKQALLAIKILALLLAAAFSFYVAADAIPETEFVRESMEQVEDSRETVMELSAATLAASLAISALPDDFATPLAENFADMNFYFVAILVILFLEKILIRWGIRAAFGLLIPLACFVLILYLGVRRRFLKQLAIRICILALAVAFVVPCSTHITQIVAAELTVYVEDTVRETNEGADKLTEAMEDESGERTMFEKLSDLFQTAIRDLSDLLLHFRNTIRRCMNSIAILIVTNCLMPLLTFLIFKWILREVFRIALPMPPLREAEPGTDKEGPSFRIPFDFGRKQGAEPPEEGEEGGDRG